MKYEILEQKDQLTVVTKVRYDIDGEIVEVSIPHFMPQSEADIIRGIENRGISEKRNLLAEKEVEVDEEALLQEKVEAGTVEAAEVVAEE